MDDLEWREVDDWWVLRNHHPLLRHPRLDGSETYIYTRLYKPNCAAYPVWTVRFLGLMGADDELVQLDPCLTLDEAMGAARMLSVARSTT